MTSQALPRFYVLLSELAQKPRLVHMLLPVNMLVWPQRALWWQRFPWPPPPNGGSQTALNNELGGFESKEEKKGHRSDTEDWVLEIYLHLKHPLALCGNGFSTCLNSVVSSQQTFSSVVRAQSRFCCAECVRLRVAFVNPWCR